MSVLFFKLLVLVNLYFKRNNITKVDSDDLAYGV